MNSRIDLPLAGYTEDEPLGLAPYARALSTFVKTCETPLTIGIQGDWGIGKTSLLNMVTDRLARPETSRDGRDHLTVYFNTWQYAQLEGESHLIIALLGDLVRRIGALRGAGPESRDKAKSLLAKVGRMAVSAGSQALLNKVGIDGAEVMKAADGDEDDLDAALPAALRMVRLVTEYRAEFETLVQALLAGRAAGSRLVIMIDDLDRIRPARALELLSAVKNFLDVPGCVFLLAVDYEVIQRGVAETMGQGERRRHGKSYFDKIIQVPFNMPVASYQVDRYVLALLGWTWDGGAGRYAKTGGAEDLYFKSQQFVSAEVATDLKNLTGLTVGQNPRAIKRAANYFALLKLVFDENGGQALVPGRQDLYLRLLYAMACFHLAYPELFTLFVQEPTPSALRRLEDIDVLGSLPQMRRIAERVDDADETMSRIAGFFDQLVAIVDTDGSAALSAAEFKPVLEVLKYSRLTSATIQEAEDGFAKIRERVLHFAAHWTTESKVTHLSTCIGKLQASNWNDALRLRIREAGARFFNLTWEGALLGSVASSKGDPLQMYLKDTGGLVGRLSEASRPFVTEAGYGHYGVGSLRLNLWDVAKRPDAVEILNDLLRAALTTSSPASAP